MTGGTAEKTYQNRLRDLLRKYDIPGVSVAILADGDVRCSVAGVTNIDTQEPVSNETIFLIGSITKLFTTTLIMQFVETGVVHLDEPVKTYLPDLALSDQNSTNEITVRDLLTHQSGITGDYLYDPGSGNDAIERYVRSLASLPMLHPPRELFSYSNSAFILAGSLVERLTGQSWHEAVRDRLIDPLGMKSVLTLPTNDKRLSVAVAHQRSPERKRGFRVGEMWPEFHAGAPAGFTPYATASDVVAFAKLHLDGGRTSAGHSLLSESSVALMQKPQVASVPSGAFDLAGWGLGWALHQYGTEPVIGHNGGTSAVLRVLPEKSFAIAVLTNVSGGLRLAHEIIWEIVGERFGLDVAHYPAAQPGQDATKLQALEGVYWHLDNRAAIQVDGDRLLLTTGTNRDPAGEDVVLHPIGTGTYLGEFKERGVAKVSFLEPDSLGRPAYLHIGLRAYRRDT